MSKDVSDAPVACENQNDILRNMYMHKIMFKRPANEVEN